MSRRRVAVFGVSAALHLGAVGLLLVIAGFGASSAILVDLRSDEVGGPQSASRGDPAVSVRSRQASTRIRSIGSSRTGPSDPARAVSAPAPTLAPEGQRPAGNAQIAAEQDPTPSPTVGPPSAAAPAQTAASALAAAPPPAAVAPPMPAPAGPTPTGALPLATDAGAASASGPVARADGAAVPSAKEGADGTGSAGRAERSSVGGTRGEGGWSAALGAAGEGQGGLPPEYAPYLQRFRRRLAESMRYPLAARRRGLAGTVEIEVVVEPSGRIAEARVIASSSHAVLDEAALDTVKHLPTEPFPDRLPRRPLRIRLPLAFELE